MKILIIGGTRFLGYYLTRRLLDAGMQVTLFNRGITPDDFGKHVQRVTGDRKNYKKFYEAFRRERFDAVIDLIGYDPEDVEVAEKTFRDHIGQYIFISTGQVYLITENKHLPASEEDYFQDLIPCPPGEEKDYRYGLKKRQIEDFLTDVYQSRDFPSIRFRCPIIQGPRDYTQRLYSYLLRMEDGNPIIIPEGGDSIIRHVYVQDVINAVLSVLGRNSFRGKVYNLAQEEVLSLTQFLDLAAELMSKKVDIVKFPERFLAEHGLDKTISPFSGRWVSYLDPSLAQSELNFKSTPPENWLPAVIYYFTEEYRGEKPDNYRFRPREIELTERFRTT